jgi:hypothetical protein
MGFELTTLSYDHDGAAADDEPVACIVNLYMKIEIHLFPKLSLLVTKFMSSNMTNSGFQMIFNNRVLIKVVILLRTKS